MNRFSPAAFNRLLGGPMRQAFGWRKASSCPCLEDGQPDPTCALCRGKGRTWAAEVVGWAGMTSQEPKKATAAFGNWTPGDAVITIPNDSPLYGCGWYDRFRAIDSDTTFSEVVIPDVNDHLLGSIKQITRVFWKNDAGDAYVEGGIPTVATNGALVFASGAPPEGVQFTVEGRRWDELYCYDKLPSDRNVGISGLPLKLNARAFDMFGR